MVGEDREREWIGEGTGRAGETGQQCKEKINPCTCTRTLYMYTRM